MARRFSAPACRVGTDSLKWSRYRRFPQGQGPDDVLPMWVADADLPTPAHVRDALVARAQHAMYGYPVSSSATSAFQSYARSFMGSNVSKEEVIHVPGLVVGLNLSVRALTRASDAVATFAPVYPPFLSVPASLGRALAPLPFRKDPARHNSPRMDFAALARRFEDPTRPKISLFFLCHPHNPTGVVHTKAELVELLELCRKHEAIVVSDEVHNDLTLNGAHTPCMGLGYDENLVSMYSPSKTFNVAGLNAAVLVVKNPALRAALTKHMRSGLVADSNVMGLAAMTAAYGETEASRSYVSDLQALLGAHRELLSEAFPLDGPIAFNGKAHDATYLAWLDGSRLLAARPDIGNLHEFMLRRARVAMNDGSLFYAPEERANPEAKAKLRLNFACSTKTLRIGIERVQRACREALA